MYTATLACGTVLAFEASSHLPASGDSVPCRRHGYCIVDQIGTCGATRSLRARRSRAEPRAQDELLEWLRGRSTTTIPPCAVTNAPAHGRRSEPDDLLAVDHDTGRVAVRLFTGTRQRTLCNNCCESRRAPTELMLARQATPSRISTLPVPWTGLLERPAGQVGQAVGVSPFNNPRRSRTVSCS